MEKRSYIAPWQLVLVLVVTRLFLSTAHFITLNVGRSIQDVIPALPVSFLLNMLVAIPLLVLAKQFGGHDPAECASLIWGKAAGVIVALLYSFYFGSIVVMRQAAFNLFFKNAFIPDANDLAIYLPLVVIVIYGVCRGLESIVRFGTIVFVLFTASLAALMATLIPSIRPNISYGFLLPLFYSGPGVMLKEVLVGFNSNVQIACVAFAMPFFKSGTSGGKLFFKWNLMSILFLLAEFGLCIAVLGPFSTTQFYPLRAISAQSSVSVFVRLDSIFGIIWFLNALLTALFYTFLQVYCLTKVGLSRYRKWTAVIVGIVNILLSYWARTRSITLRYIFLSPYFTAFNLFFLFALPLLLLIGGLFHKAVLQRKGALHETA